MTLSLPASSMSLDGEHVRPFNVNANLWIYPKADGCFPSFPPQPLPLAVEASQASNRVEEGFVESAVGSREDLREQDALSVATRWRFEPAFGR